MDKFELAKDLLSGQRAFIELHQERLFDLRNGVLQPLLADVLGQSAVVELEKKKAQRGNDEITASALMVQIEELKARVDLLKKVT